MDLANGERSSELLQAQAHVWNHIFNFINSMSLKCAIQLGIPDIIHDHCQPMTLHELVAKLPVRPNKTLCVYRLMRILVHSGFFTKQRVQESADEEGYVLANASRLLLKDHPLSVTPFLLLLDPDLTEPWDYASAWFQNDDPTPFFTAHGRTLWFQNENPTYPLVHLSHTDVQKIEGRKTFFPLLNLFLLYNCKTYFFLNKIKN